MAMRLARDAGLPVAQVWILPLVEFEGRRGPWLDRTFQNYQPKRPWKWLDVCKAAASRKARISWQVKVGNTAMLPDRNGIIHLGRKHVVVRLCHESRDVDYRQHDKQETISW
jgi:hypothetical protein